MKMISKAEFVEVLDDDEELRLVTAGFVEVCHECPYMERTPFLTSWGCRKIRSALKNNIDSSRPPQRQLAQPSLPLMITGAGEDDDDEEKVVGDENGAASGRENKEEVEILMSEEESTSTSTSDYYNQDLEVNKRKNKKRKRKEVLEELREHEKKLSQQNKELKQAYWNVRDFYEEQQQERALLEELKSRRLHPSTLWQHPNGDRLTPPLNKRAQFGQYIHGY